MKKDEIQVVREEENNQLYGKEMIAELKKREKVINDSIKRIDVSFEKIAFSLHWIQRNEAFRARGCEDVVTYAKEKFGYEKSTCYSLIAIVDRFAKHDEEGNVIEEIDEPYCGFSSSKLSLMIGLPDELIKELKPEMSVRDIKAYVKKVNGKALPEMPEAEASDEMRDVTEETDITMSAHDDLEEYEAEGIIADEKEGETADNIASITYDIVDCVGDKKADFEKMINEMCKNHPNATVTIMFKMNE